VLVRLELNRIAHHPGRTASKHPLTWTRAYNAGVPIFAAIRDLAATPVREESSMRQPPTAYIDHSGEDRPGETSSGSSPRTPPSPSDLALLDAYSQAVVHVVETVSPAVLSLTGHSPGEGSGSGFLVTPDGFAVTNSHVANGRTELVALTSEGDRLRARVIGDDPATDLAILRVAASDLPYSTLGKSQSGVRWDWNRQSPRESSARWGGVCADEMAD
jgi:S1-C subfamily serine protease